MAITFTGGQSYFKPMTFDDMMKPLLYYAEAYDKADADLSDLAKQTEYWGDIANRENSPEAFEMYNRYSAELNNYVDALSKGNLRSVNSNLLRMKGRYARDIQPIETAYNAMKEANDLRDKAGPDAIFQVNRYNSIDQFLHGKTANNKYQSKEALTKKTEAMIEAEMQAELQKPEFQELLANDAYWLTVQHNGGSSEDLKAALAHAIGSNPKLKNKFIEVKERVAKQAGWDEHDDIGKQSIEDAIDTGLYKGLDKPVYNLVNNVDKITAYQQRQLAQSDKQLRYNLALHGLHEDKDGRLVYNIEDDPSVQKALAIQDAKNKGRLGTSASSVYSKYSVADDAFIDVKNPHKSGFLKYYADYDKPVPEGTHVDYSKLETEQGKTTGKYPELDKKVESKTGGKYSSLKAVIDDEIRASHPGIKDEEIPVMAALYDFVVTSDGNVFRLKKPNVGTWNPLKMEFDLPTIPGLTTNPQQQSSAYNVMPQEIDGVFDD